MIRPLYGQRRARGFVSVGDGDADCQPPCDRMLGRYVVLPIVR